MKMAMIKLKRPSAVIHNSKSAIHDLGAEGTPSRRYLQPAAYKVLERACAILLAAMLIVSAAAGCAKQNAENGGYTTFTSFRDIPGVTDDEIKEIEALQKQGTSFVYASNFSTESFVGDDGVIRGFAAYFCDWLSGLFGIPFIPKNVEWDELIKGLENGTIDFTGELAADDYHRMTYTTTEDIAQREVIRIRLNDSMALDEIAKIRPLRYAFLEEHSSIVSGLRQHEGDEFEAVYIKSYSDIYNMLESGELDAFFGDTSDEAAFDYYGDITVDTYFPIIYDPVSLSTQNPDNKVVIDVVQKALCDGSL